MTDPRTDRLAQLLVDYSTNVQLGQQVLIRGTLAAAPLLQAVYERVLERGAHAFVMAALPGQQEAFLRLAQAQQLDYVSPLEKLAIESFDAVISTLADENTRALSGVPPERQVRVSKARAPLMAAYMDRAASGALQWVVTQYPTNAAAQDAEISLRDYEQFVYGACHVAEAGDAVQYWRAQYAEHERLIAWLKPRAHVHARGPNIDLQLSIKGRSFINAGGVHNMPDGEIFTGPVEDSVNGWVKFSFPVVAYGREIEGIELEFAAGRVVQARAAKNEDFLIQTLDTDAGARFLGEWAIGTNFGIQRFTKSILFDEKIGGTLHMAVGRGYPESGSRNQSAVHWDMICDLRADSEILVDGELFFRNGRFQI